MSEVKRYGHIGSLVTTSTALLEIYPSMSVYVLARDYAAAQSELSGYRAANMVLRDELAAERLRADTAVANANDAERKLAALRSEIAVLKDQLESQEDLLLQARDDAEHYEVMASFDGEQDD